MKRASVDNREFIAKYRSIRSRRNYMTLFIDNVRLYRREIKASNESDQIWINKLMAENSLLDACAELGDMQFIIFSHLEDTPIDAQIQGKIPANVLSIHAANALFFDDEKINPLPYGLQRKLRWKDNHLPILRRYMFTDLPPENLLYVNHSVTTNAHARSGIKELFLGKKWARVETSFIDYALLLRQVKQHKFMICPIGNAVDCHRNWETLYMRRVPVMKKNNYLQRLFRDFPVLFVDDYDQITEDLLLANNHLFEEAQRMDFQKLDLLKIFEGIIADNSKAFMPA